MFSGWGDVVPGRVGPGVVVPSPPMCAQFVFSPSSGHPLVSVSEVTESHGSV